MTRIFDQGKIKEVPDLRSTSHSVQISAPFGTALTPIVPERTGIRTFSTPNCNGTESRRSILARTAYKFPPRMLISGSMDCTVSSLPKNSETSTDSVNFLDARSGSTGISSGLVTIPRSISQEKSSKGSSNRRSEISSFGTPLEDRSTTTRFMTPITSEHNVSPKQVQRERADIDSTQSSSSCVHRVNPSSGCPSQYEIYTKQATIPIYSPRSIFDLNQRTPFWQYNGSLEYPKTVPFRFNDQYRPAKRTIDPSKIGDINGDSPAGKVSPRIPPSVMITDPSDMATGKKIVHQGGLPRQETVQLNDRKAHLPTGPIRPVTAPVNNPARVRCTFPLEEDIAAKREVRKKVAFYDQKIQANTENMRETLASSSMEPRRNKEAPQRKVSAKENDRRKLLNRETRIIHGQNLKTRKNLQIASKASCMDYKLAE